MLNFANSKSSDVAGAKSASEMDVYNFRRRCAVFSPDCQAWHKTTQVLAGTISAPWSPSFSRSQGSQKSEASFEFDTTGKCCFHRICLTLNQQHTLHNTRCIHPILCCTRRCAEAHGTRESHQSCHALGHTRWLSLMPASLTFRSTKSIPALPSSPHIIQANMKICSHSPHLSKNPSLPWNCCGTRSASPSPPPYPTTLRMADTRVGFSMVPRDPEKCEEFRCSYNSTKLKACSPGSLMRGNSMSRHNCV